MNEYEIALEKVLPYIHDHLHWPDQLISKYGRVPVQIGGSAVWADFMCYISKNQKPIPWLLIEVKQSDSPLEQALPQAESYSLILDAPFFCITDGSTYDFYMTGESQGKSIKLENLPPIPTLDYLITGVEYVAFPSQIYNLIDLFIIGLKEEEKFFNDTERHYEAANKLYENVFMQLDSLSSKELKEAIEQYVMKKTPNKNLIFKQIDDDFNKIKEILRFIKDFKGDPIININRLINKDENLHINGAGIFFISQLLSGAHPNDYVVLEENVSEALRNLGITDIVVKNDTANGYIYVNEICKKLYKEKLESKLEKHSFGLAAVHNFLWHYYVHYCKKGKWF
jgi:hypothetical protein